LVEEDLAAKINSLIRQDLRGRASEVAVTIRNGIATLRGKIATNAQRRVLEDQIKSLPGMDRVRDILVTDPE